MSNEITHNQNSDLKLTAKHPSFLLNEIMTVIY
jgi:hypothetical protein